MLVWYIHRMTATDVYIHTVKTIISTPGNNHSAHVQTCTHTFVSENVEKLTYGTPFCANPSLFLSHSFTHTCTAHSLFLSPSLSHSLSHSLPLFLPPSLPPSLTQRFTDPKHHSPACTTYYKEHNSTFSQTRMGSERAPFGQAALRFRRNRRDKEIPGSVETACTYIHILCVSL